MNEKSPQLAIVEWLKTTNPYKENVLHRTKECGSSLIAEQELDKDIFCLIAYRMVRFSGVNHFCDLLGVSDILDFIKLNSTPLLGHNDAAVDDQIEEWKYGTSITQGQLPEPNTPKEPT